MDKLTEILNEYKDKIDAASTSRNTIQGKKKRVEELQRLTAEICDKIDAECHVLGGTGLSKEELKEKANSILGQLLKYAAN
jgi:hypothetical protein